MMKIIACVGPRCNADGRGSAQLARLRAAAAARFAEALAQGRLVVDTRDCLRLCTSDPVVRLEPSGDAVANPDVDELMRNIADALRE